MSRNERPPEWITEVTFRVYGQPKPAGSKRARPIYKGGEDNRQFTGRVVAMETNKGTKLWREIVHASGAAAWEGRPLLDGPLRLVIRFIFLRPKSHYGTGRNSGKLKAQYAACPYRDRMPDLTKLTRSTEDALSKVVWTDDSRVVAQETSKGYGDSPGAVVTVQSLNPRYHDLMERQQEA
ncbi:MAG: RusA family crossover junction endodeoxyribonuclease [bacterium]